MRYLVLAGLPAIGLLGADAYTSLSSTTLALVRPLSTANAPRLIPHFEFKRYKFDHLVQEIPFSHPQFSFSNPLEWFRHVFPEKLLGAKLAGVPASAAGDNNHNGAGLRGGGGLFGDVIAQTSSRLVAYFRKVLAATLIVASSLTSPVSPAAVGARKALAKPVAAAVALAGGVMATPLAARAGVLRKYTQLSPSQRLATTPLFFLSNSQGQPYLQEDVQTGSPQQRIIVYFMSAEDAYDYLDEMAQASGSNSNDFRVMATSMEKVVSKIQAKKQSRKLGRYSVGNIFRIQPAIRQCEHAEALLQGGGGRGKKNAARLDAISIPMFSAKGMAIRRATGEVVTPFYFSYEDLKEDWSRLGQQGKLVVSVHDFGEVMLLAKGVSAVSLVPSTATSTGTTSDLAVPTSDPAAASALLSPAIIAPRREVELLRRYYRNEAGIRNEYSQARM